MPDPRNISIVGGRGRMGVLMERFLRAAGHSVTIADEADGPVAWAEVAESDVILLAVPIPALEGVVEKLGPLTRPETAVIDIASVKEEPIRLMLHHCRSEVVGTHPLFGPGTETLEGQVVFVCPARGTTWAAWLRSFLFRNAAVVVDMEPGEHDRLMARVQVLRHLLLFCFGEALHRLDFDLPAELHRAGPWFSGLVEMLGHQLGQGPGLYADLALNNPHTVEVTEALVRATSELSSLYAGSDREALVERIGSISTYILSGLAAAGARPEAPRRAAS